MSAAGTTLAAYTYKANNGLLEKVTYPDGSYIQTEYDSLDRPVRNVCRGAGSSTETVLEEFTYDRQGNLYHVNAARAGRAYDLQYDLLDRLCRVRDNDGCIYEYTYDKNSQMTRLYHVNGSLVSDTAYAYDDDGRESTCDIGGKTRTADYDAYGRVTDRNWGSSHNANQHFDYPLSGTRASARPNKITTGGYAYYYYYDANGNITSITKQNTATLAAEELVRYCYDEWNQLIREDSRVQNKTIVYAYNTGGNMTSLKEYAYTTADTITSAPTRTVTGTYNNAWKDQLTSWDG